MPTPRGGTQGGPTFIHEQQTLADMYISRHQKPPAFSQHSFSLETGPTQIPSPAGLSLLQSPLGVEGRELHEGEKEREKGKPVSVKLMLFVAIF